MSSDKDDLKDQEVADQLIASLLGKGPISEEVKLRVATLYGDITQEKCSDAIYNLLYLKESGKQTIQDPNDAKVIYQAHEPAVYDVMKMIQHECDIRTFGFGKVMSAGVVLLAAGAKGQRFVGSNCRLMIHGVSSGQQGNLDELKNELEEAKWAQKQYIKALAKDSKMSQKQIRELFSQNKNIYFNAEQAIEYGIADYVI